MIKYFGNECYKWDDELPCIQATVKEFMLSHTGTFLVKDYIGSKYVMADHGDKCGEEFLGVVVCLVDCAELIRLFLDRDANIIEFSREYLFKID